MSAAGDQRYDVTWKVPAQGDLRLAVQVRFPADTKQITPPQGMFADTAYVGALANLPPRGPMGQTARIDSIAGGVTDVIVRIERQDGTSQMEHLLPQKPQFIVQGPASAAEVASSYLGSGSNTSSAVSIICCSCSRCC